MPDTKITALTAIGANPIIPATFPIPMVDLTDTSMAASGTTKKVTVNQILGAGGTATLASATITGDLTAARLIVTGGTIPTNGLWLPTTNTLEFAANSLAQYRIAPLGVFSWYDGAGGTRMTLNSTGLAIGDTAFSGTRLTLRETATNPNALAMTNRNATQTWRIGVDVSAVDDKILGFYDSTSTTFRMQLTDTGNLALGVTPSAWAVGVKCLEIGSLGSGISSGSTFSGTLYASMNAYNDGSWKFARNAAAGLYGLNSDKSFAWFQSSNTPSVGGAITFTQAMGLDASGNLLVGVASNPNTARAYFRYDTLTIQPVINSASIVAASTSWNHFVGQSGNGSTVTTNNVFIRGNGDIVNANGVYGTISDLRLKENISDARNYLSDLLKLRVVNYSLKEEASAVANKLGFIAQEVEQVFPKMVDTDKEDTKSIKISVLIPMLVKAIQELTARVQTLEAK